MSKELNCIIVDDEPPAIRLLEKFAQKVSFLTVEKTFTKPLEALTFLEYNSVDLVFLDIQMPNITGIQLSKIIKDNVQIIFTSAYPDFALESYNVSAMDYLLKPIEFDRFYRAVQKVIPAAQKTITGPPIDDYIFLKTDGKNKFTRVFLGHIRFIQGLKNYVSLQLQDEQIITYSTLKHFSETLPKDEFVQIHKSYIVSIKHIDRIENDSVWIEERQLPVGNTYRKSFFEKIHQRGL